MRAQKKLTGPRLRADLCSLNAQLKYERDAHSRQYVLGMGRRSGFEHLTCYCGATGRHLVRHTDRAPDSVCLPKAQLMRAKQRRERIIFHHNHPQGLSLSVVDVRHLVERPGLLEVFAHGHDGSWYWATSRRVRDGLDMVSHGEKAFIKAAKFLRRQGIVFKEELAPHLFNLALDHADIIRYKYGLSESKAADVATVPKESELWLLDSVKSAIQKERQQK